MAVIVIASSGSPESASIRVGGDGLAVGDFHEITGSLVMEVESQVGGRCVARLTRPNATSGPTEQTVQIDVEVGEVSRVRVPLGALVVSTDPASVNYVGVGMSWVSRERIIQDAVVAERIRRALTYTRGRLLEFPNNQRFAVATWETIGNELAAEVAQKVVGGTIEVG